LAGTFCWANAVFDRLQARPLVPIANQALISYAISWLRSGAVSGITICGNRETRALEPYIRQHLPADLSWTYREDPMPRGAAGCLVDAAAASPCETYVVTDAAAMPGSVDLPQLLLRHRASRAEVTMVAYPEPTRPGTPGALIPVGIYVVNQSALESVPARGFADIKEHLVPRLYQAGARVLVFETHGPVPRVLNAQSYLAVNAMAIESVVSSPIVPAGYLRRGDALVHAEATLAPDAVLAGPVLIGRGVQVRRGAVVIGPTSIGCDAVVNEGALVSRSAVWRRSRVASAASLDLCIVGDGAVITTRSAGQRANVKAASGLARSA
jgi:mannose-1-phosphate guanylyltransferase/phosphomannomutase